MSGDLVVGCCPTRSIYVFKGGSVINSVFVELWSNFQPCSVSFSENSHSFYCEKKTPQNFWKFGNISLFWSLARENSVVKWKKQALCGCRLEICIFLCRFWRHCCSISRLSLNNFLTRGQVIIRCWLVAKNIKARLLTISISWLEVYNVYW